MSYKLLRPLLFSLDPEEAHQLTLKSLKFFTKMGLTTLIPQPPAKPRKVMGLEFKNPVGLAAGLDKNAEYIDALSILGFGFLEVGTVTPNSQIGNPKPRLFRLPQQEGLINRMGFNGKGLDYFVRQLQRSHYKGILGISITPNNTTPLEDEIEDYRTCLNAVYPYASYISLDVSCPNVPKKGAIMTGRALMNLLQAIKMEQEILAQNHQKYVPLAVKVSPDLTKDEVYEVAEILVKTGMDGVIATNTTQKRPRLAYEMIALERGGLSGRPLFHLSLEVVKHLAEILNGRLPIIAVGGIMSADNAQAMLDAGASLLQIYTGLIYRGPKLIREIVKRVK